MQPRASRPAIAGWREDGALGVRVTAAPVEGAANEAARALLAEALGVRGAAVTILKGARSRDKVVRVTGLTLADVQARLGRRAGGGTGVGRMEA